MPFEGKQITLSGLIAGASLVASSTQYKFVKISADNTCVLCAATTDVPCGILQAPAATTGDPVTVCVAGESMLQAGGSITAGNQVSTNASGQGQTAVAGQYVVAQAINIAGATTAGTLITVTVNCLNPTLL